MNREETIALWSRCEQARRAALDDGAKEFEAHEAAKQIWNSWARQLLIEREQLAQKGIWLSKFGRLDDKPYFDREIGENQPTKDWIERATADFRNVHFKSENFQDRDIDNKVPFRDTLSIYKVTYAGIEIDFSGFIFPGVTDLYASIWKVHVNFSNCTFYDTLSCRRAIFCESVSYFLSNFKRAGWFSRTIFERHVDFRQSDFGDIGRFSGVQFMDDARFEDACFMRAWFISSIFHTWGSFSGSVFQQEANFSGVQAKYKFDLDQAQFLHEVPDFTQANFVQAPSFDDVKLPRANFWTRGNSALVSKYRALRRLAVLGHDYEREQVAFKGELRSRRWVIDKWHGPSVWLGIAYDIFSDCGRSIWRPFVTWTLLTLVFSSFYLAQSGDGDPRRCGGSLMSQALYLSGKNALVFFSGTRDARINQSYLCLYGGDVAQPSIPTSVTLLESFVQMPISAILIFLFLLGVRNQFKIK